MRPTVWFSQHARIPQHPVPTHQPHRRRQRQRCGSLLGEADLQFVGSVGSRDELRFHARKHPDPGEIQRLGTAEDEGEAIGHEWEVHLLGGSRGGWMEHAVPGVLELGV
jgi:hypothetical protein